MDLIEIPGFEKVVHYYVRQDVTVKDKSGKETTHSHPVGCVAVGRAVGGVYYRGISISSISEKCFKIHKAIHKAVGRMEKAFTHHENSDMVEPNRSDEVAHDSIIRFIQNAPKGIFHGSGIIFK